MKTLDLLNDFKSGRESAAEELFEKHLRAVREMARIRMATNPAARRAMDSHDVMQEALQKAWQGLSGLELVEEGQFVNWLARIVQNTVIDAARRMNRDKRATDREASRVEIQHKEAAQATPSEEAMGKELSEKYIEALEGMGERYREVILLRRHAQCSFAEIARALDLEEENRARALLSRALADLARRLDGRLPS